MSDNERVTYEIRFAREDVLRVLEVAESTGHEVERAKDDGAYLMTWDADGTPSPDLLVYAEGHGPPRGMPGGAAAPEDEWWAARAATQRVWGGDDFAVRFSPQQIRVALEGRDFLCVRTELAVHPWPPDAPPDLRGRRDPLHELLSVTLT